MLLYGVWNEAEVKVQKRLMVDVVRVGLAGPGVLTTCVDCMNNTTFP
jgi:hypothetical protein